MTFTEWLEKEKEQLTPYMWRIAFELNKNQGAVFLFNRGVGKTHVAKLYEKYKREVQ